MFLFLNQNCPQFKGPLRVLHTRFTMHLNRTTAAAIPTYFDSFNWCDSETFEVQQRWQQVKVGPSAAGIFVVPDLCKTSDCYEGNSTFALRDMNFRISLTTPKVTAFNWHVPRERYVTRIYLQSWSLPCTMSCLRSTRKSTDGSFLEMNQSCFASGFLVKIRLTHFLLLALIPFVWRRLSPAYCISNRE